MYKLTAIFLFCLGSGYGLAQPKLTNNTQQLTVYVWEFTTQHADTDIKKLANLLTNDFETELAQSGLYQILEIRERGRVEEQRALQQLIYNIDELTEDEQRQLREQRAEAVFFGKLIYNEQSRENTLEVKLQHLDGRILRKGSLYLNPSELVMNQSRRSKVKQLFREVHEDIFAAREKQQRALKQQQYDLIFEMLNQYLLRSENLTTQFRRLDLSLLSQDYLNEYNQTIKQYDELINDLLSNHSRYENLFRSAWGTEMATELAGVFQKALEFHRRYLFKSLNRRNEQLVHYAKNSNKKARTDLQLEFERDKREFAETMNDQWPAVKGHLEKFLLKLRTLLY